MGTPIFPDLGKHCSVDICKQIDFLPFSCDRCLQVFCLDHRNYMKHECPKGNKGDVTVVICPLCATEVRLNPNEDPSISWEEHVNSVCDPSEAVKKNKKQCPVTRCREVLTFSNTIKCRDCSISHCLKHRFGPDHTCSGPKIPESSVLCTNTNEATMTPASSSSSVPASSSSSSSLVSSSSSALASSYSSALASSSSSALASSFSSALASSYSSALASSSSSALASSYSSALASSSSSALASSSSSALASSSSSAPASSSSSRGPSRLAIRAHASSSSSRWSPMAPASSSSSSRWSPMAHDPSSSSSRRSSLLARRAPTSQLSTGNIVTLVASLIESRNREQSGETGQDAAAMQVEDEDEDDFDWELE